MPVVRAALGNQGHLCARSRALIRVVIRGRHAELLHGILRNRQHRRKRVAAVLIVHIHAVQADVALVAARPVYSPVASVLVFISRERRAQGVSRERHARLQAQQFRHISSVQWNVFHLILPERIPDGSIHQVQWRGLSRHRDTFARRPDLQQHVRRDRRVHQQDQIFSLVLRESLSRHRQGVISRLQLLELVPALNVRYRAPLRSRFHVVQCHRGPGHALSTRVANLATQRR